MKNLILTTALALIATGPASAIAACSPTVVGNLNVFQCTSTQSAADGDDLMDFINKNSHPVTSITGSLGMNSSAQVNQNVTTATDSPGASFTQQANGFAELKSNNANSPSNTLRDIIDTPIVPSTLPKTGDPFVGFDGFLMRGQVDDTNPSGNWDGVITMTIDFSVGSPQTLTFNGDTRNMDIGTIGFDEKTEPGVLVTKVLTALDSTGAFNEVKQFDFSVHGQTGTIPEPRTWVMVLVGFGLLALGGVRKARTSRALDA